MSHADKAAVQDDLIARLAGILESLDLEQSLIFFKVFLSTMRREWAGTDRLKLDRFYLLLRQFLARVFMVLQKHDWNEGTVGKFMDALVERTLLATDEYPAAGINLHLVDVFLDELKERQPLSAATLRLMLQPFYSTLAVAADKSLLKKIKERIFDSLLTDAQSFIQGQQDSKKIDYNNFGPHVAALPLAASLFDVASSENTLQENHKLVYEIHDDFCRLEKLVTMAGLVELAPDEKPCEEGTPEGVRRHSLRQCIKRSKDEKLAANSSAGAETNLGRKLKARGALVGTEKQKDSPLLENLKSAKVMKEDGVKKGHKRSIVKLPKGKELGDKFVSDLKNEVDGGETGLKGGSVVSLLVVQPGNMEQGSPSNKRKKVKRKALTGSAKRQSLKKIHSDQSSKPLTNALIQECKYLWMAQIGLHSCFHVQHSLEMFLMYAIREIALSYPSHCFNQMNSRQTVE